MGYECSQLSNAFPKGSVESFQVLRVQPGKMHQSHEPHREQV